MYCLGLCYANGWGVDIDYAQAVKWYKTAAELKNADSMYCLGICYEHGLGVVPNYAQAIEWYKRAVELGFDEAKRKLNIY